MRDLSSSVIKLVEVKFFNHHQMYLLKVRSQVYFMALKRMEFIKQMIQTSQVVLNLVMLELLIKMVME